MCILYENRKPNIYTKDAVYEVNAMSLSSLFDMLNKLSFFKANSGSIVNLNYIQRFSKKSIFLVSDQEIYISRGRYNKLEQKIMDYELNKGKWG